MLRGSLSCEYVIVVPRYPDFLKGCQNYFLVSLDSDLFGTLGVEKDFSRPVHSMNSLVAGGPRPFPVRAPVVRVHCVYLVVVYFYWYVVQWNGHTLFMACIAAIAFLYTGKIRYCRLLYDAVRRWWIVWNSGAVLMTA